MLIALGVLLIALIAVVVKDWDFWFPANDDGEYTAAGLKKRASPAPAPSSNSNAAIHASREHKSAKTPTTPEAPMAAAVTERAALPPLQVEVVAGNQRRSIPAKSNAIHLDVGADGASSPSAPELNAEPVVNASDRVQLSPEIAQSVTAPVAPSYPMLARQMKVQGAVILQALISREGTIQELQVLNGPGILASAAREAVKQWRFKPYYLNGQPVETQARITVNFTISTN